MQTIRPWTIGSPTELFATRIVTAEANAAAGCDCGRASVKQPPGGGMPELVSKCGYIFAYIFHDTTCLAVTLVTSTCLTV